MECCGGPLELEPRDTAGSAEFAVFAPGERDSPPVAAAPPSPRGDAPYEVASCCSHVTYGYVEPLLALRARRPLAYEDLPPIAHPLARRQIVAHLERLEALGRLG